MADRLRAAAQHRLDHGAEFPYDAPDAWREMAEPKPLPATDWAHAAARGILADLTDRRGIKWSLQEIDEDVRAELVASLAEIIRAALAQQQAEPVQSAARVDAYDMIDRFLRNNLRDDDYAEYSAALDSLYTAPQQTEPVQRKPLTVEEMLELIGDEGGNNPRTQLASAIKLIRATERAHGIKETK